MAISAILLLLAVTSQSVVGLLAIWAGLGRGHWFVRVAALAAVLGLALLIPAYELVVVFTVQCLVIVPTLLVVRRLRARSEGTPASQFTIRDLLLATAVVAGLSAVGASVPRDVWTSYRVVGIVPPFLQPSDWPPWAIYPLNGLIAGCVALAAAALVLCRWRRWQRVALLLFVAVPTVVAAGMAAYQVATTEADWLEALLWGAAFHVDWWTWVPYLTLSLLLPSIPVAVWLLRARVRYRDESVRTAARPRHQGYQAAVLVLFGLLGVVLLAPPMWAYYVLMTTPPIPNDPLPEPNGYDTLLRVGKRLENVAVPVHDEELPEAERATPKEFRDFSDRYRAVLDTVHLALDNPYRVPLKYDPTDLDLEALQGVRQTARALVADAGVASMNGDDEAASDRYLDTLRLGDAYARGGLVLHWLVGSAVQSIGLFGVHERIDSMTASLRRDWIGRLPALEAQFESMDACSERDDIWSNHAYGWQGRLIHVLTDDPGESEMWAQCEIRRQALHRLLIVELALANYRDEHGTHPRALADLVPEHLERLPDDPFSGKPLVYRLTDEGFRLYSVGPNGVDDGGKSFEDDGDDEWFQ
ncbi:MAG: hypothetical protein NTW96_01205 [Planctomycetia bacterium]|nr:hypothetical protein [Planctomycetia bacterium]